MFTNLEGRVWIFVSLLFLVQKFPVLFVQEVLQVGDGHQGLVEGRWRGGRCLAGLKRTRLIALPLLEGAEKTQVKLNYIYILDGIKLWKQNLNKEIKATFVPFAVSSKKVKQLFRFWIPPNKVVPPCVPPNRWFDKRKTEMAMFWFDS